MSLPKFKKSNIQSTKGLQPSKFDELLPMFENQGDCLEFDEDDLSRQRASGIARRFRELTGKPFHSFFNARNKKVTIRLRLESEVVTEKDDVPAEPDGDDEEEGLHFPDVD